MKTTLLTVVAGLVLSSSMAIAQSTPQADSQHPRAFMVVPGEYKGNAPDASQHPRTHKGYPGARDTDKDGRPDRIDRDIDGDGRANRFDHDIDGDGVPNRFDQRPLGAQHQRPQELPPHLFKKAKQEKLFAVEAQIAQLHTFKACITKAQTPHQLKACEPRNAQPSRIMR